MSLVTLVFLALVVPQGGPVILVLAVIAVFQALAVYQVIPV